MINKNIGRLRLELYNGVDELPIERYHKFNLYCLMSAGIGNDVESITKHMGSIYQSLNKKDIERLKIQFQNYYHSLYLIIDKVDTTNMAFACLIHSVNGREVTDLSEEGIRRLQIKITRAERRKQIVQLFVDLKKKLRMK
jgi:hypothetical protein